MLYVVLVLLTFMGAASQHAFEKEKSKRNHVGYIFTRTHNSLAKIMFLNNIGINFFICILYKLIPMIKRLLLKVYHETASLKRYS